MLIKLYIFSLVLGAILLGASIFLGDADIDADADVDVDADADADATHADFDGADAFLWTFKSVRFWTFFVAFFGLTGLALDGLDLLSPQIALVVAAAVGFLVGTGAHHAVRWLSKKALGQVAGSSDYIGATARVLIPLEAGRTGKVRLSLRGTIVDVLAVSEEDIGVGEEAIIIEMDGINAKVAKLGKELKGENDEHAV